MLLAVDIGNTSISLGVFAPSPAGTRPDLRLRAKLATDRHRSADEYAVTLRSLLTDRGCAPADISRVMIGSVVPPLTHVLRTAVGQLMASVTPPVPVSVAGSGMRTGISLLVDDPNQLGADIVSNAAAATWLYGAPVLIIDFGTATVLSAVRCDRALLGVSIAPGISTALDGLRTAAAQLPYVELKAPGQVLGKNTPASTRSGIIYGTACMVDGMIDRIRAEAGWSTEVPMVATGGLSELVLPHCRHALIPEPDLTLLGLYRIAAMTDEKNAKRATRNGAVGVSS